MLLLNTIRENRESVIASLLKKRFQTAELDIDTALELDSDRKKTQTLLDTKLSEANKIAKSVGDLMKAGKKDEAEKAKSSSASLKEETKELGDKLSQIELDLKNLLYKIPNTPHESVPEGNSEENNEIVHTWGEAKDTEGLPHWDLIKKYDIVDFELGNKIAGAGFPVYKGKGAKLQRALISFFLDEAEKAGYNEIMPPILTNEESGYGTGQLPDKDGQMYYANEDNLYLIPTAEVPLTNIYRDVILKEEELPVKNAGHSLCFRREAGSWGAHVRGLNRLHQFDKVEIVRIEHPSKSYAALEEMKQHVCGLLEKLELPYRILKLCGGDISFTSALTFDFEVYSSAQKKWLEVSSVSNFETFQSNRLKLRYKDKDGKKELLHTLNGSALALPRILAAILEKNQTESGITVPKVLNPYLRFEIID